MWTWTFWLVAVARRFRANHIDRLAAVPTPPCPITQQLDLLLDARNTLGECVLWCERSGQLFWTDIAALTLHAYDPASRRARSWPMPEQLASFAFTEQPRVLLLGLASRLAWFDLDSGRITTLHWIEAELTGTRINDGRCDRQGRFVFGTMNHSGDGAALGSFYRLNADLSIERLALPKVTIANSICFSPTGDTMYFCDSPNKTILRCAYFADGSVGAPQLFADLGEAPGEPDGSTVDAAGYLWNAEWGGARVVRYAPDGTPERVLTLSASQPSCVAFGGPGMNQLFASSARLDLCAADLACQPEAGGLFHAALPDVRGMAEVRFSTCALMHTPTC